MKRSARAAAPAAGFLFAVALATAACGTPDTGMKNKDFGPDADADGATKATATTARLNEAFAAGLPLGDQADFEAARRGFIATDEGLEVVAADGRIMWRPADYAFMDGADVPPSVNPSLWRQGRLNNIHGLFKAADSIFQIRGYDLSNMSIIDGPEGRVIVDPLTAVENAEAALALVEREVGVQPIVAIILTHSHIDHFGGIAAILESPNWRKDGRIIAPEGFTEEAVSENVVAGVVMARRATYMFGSDLPRGPRGHVDTGLGKHPPYGRVTIADPTDIIDSTPQEMTLGGTRFIFQYTPESEAPAELTFHLPDHNAFCGAEIVSRTMHNLYTLRGAKVRDALKWSGYIDEVIELFGDDIDLIFNSHHWPVWGRAAAIDYLEKQRDTYKFIHDQTMRLATQGLTPREIAEEVELPEALRTTFANRGYYGTVRHNSKAVYQHYFGWYDGNPANLDPLPPLDSAKRTVEAMGGAAAVVENAQKAYDAGEYRWAAELLDRVVFAEPGNDAARGLLAKTYDQLGYQAESGPWRNIYLTGARELRHGIAPPKIDLTASEIIDSVPLDLFFVAMSTRLDPEKAEGVDTKINFRFSDTGQDFVLHVKNAVLHHYERSPDDDADATITVTRGFWQQVLTRQAGIMDLLTSEEFETKGSRMAIVRFFGLLDQPVEQFPIITP